MIPETSCIAGNQLLSRAALVGGRAPNWDTDQTRLRGYFEVVQDVRNVSAPPDWPKPGEGHDDPSATYNWIKTTWPTRSI